MTVGENIRRIRLERNLTQKELGKRLGTSEAYIRAYESGKRNPKPATLKKIAEQLAVRPEVLENSSFDAVTAMHRLFQLFRQYNGTLIECEDKDGKPHIAIYFETLALMNTWSVRYREYLKEIECANEITDIKKRAKRLLEIESDFDLWMDIYPDSEFMPQLLQIQKSHDETMDMMALNPKK